jgi:hypothetical protein
MLKVKGFECPPKQSRPWAALALVPFCRLLIKFSRQGWD